MVDKNACYRCGAKLIERGIPKQDFETDTVMTGKKKDKPLRRLICKPCLTSMRGQQAPK